MPKYLAQNFLAEALQHRRSLLERMLITPPHHIEFVDAYVHRGEVEDALCTSPWLLEEIDADPLTQSSGTLQDDAVLEEGVRRDLSRLLGEGGGLREGVENYQEEASLAPSDSDAGSDIDMLLSQDIDSAIEKFASSVAGGAMGGLGCMMEEFPVENIHPWDTKIEPECGQHLLEEPESPSHLALLSTRVPLAKDLTQRVKLMFIQDPLVDSSGQPYEYVNLFKSDLLLDSDFSSTHCKEGCASILAPPFEEFDHEVATTDDSEIDPVLELYISSPSSPLAPEAVGSLPLLPPPITSPEKDIMDGELMKKQSNEELKSLVQDMNISALPVVEHLDFSPSARQKPGVVDFTKLNNADVSHDSDDSGIGHALLESPCLPSTSSPITTPITKQLSTLDPFPLSPSDKLVLMSPSSEQKFLKMLWNKDKVFDSILALILPYPDIEETIETLVVGSNVLLEAMLLLNLKPLKLDGDLELDLPWDPLAESYREMMLAQRRLVWPWFTGEEGDRGDSAKGGATAWREEFSAEDSTSTAVEDDALPTGIPQGGGGEAYMSGKAGYYPSSHPLNQLHTHSSRPTLRTLNQLSSRPAALSNLPGGTKTSYFTPRNGSTMAGGRGDQSTATSLDTFMALRSSRLGIKRVSDRAEKDSTGPERKKGCLVNAGPQDTPEEEGDLSETSVTSPVFSDVCLSGEYQSAVSKIEGYAAPLITALLPFGLNVPHTGARFGGLSLDTMKFFLKQQQKVLEDNQGQEKAVELLQSCRLAACLYVLGSLVETLIHCSLTAGLGRFSSLYGKYENLIGGGLDVVKQELLQLQLASRAGSLAHPKLHQLIKIVSRWTKERRNWREKAIVVVDREFPTLSGELLDFLQSLPDLKSCVFSFTTDNSTNPLYLETVEERFHHYDCLVVPVHSIVDNFPWEKVSLLVEYEPLRTLLFPEGSFPETARLKQYVTLRTVREPSASNRADLGLHGEGLSSVQYTFIASEKITANTQLLQLLEARYSMLIIERDYFLLRKEQQKSRGVCYADLILDQSSGIVLRPLSLLGTDVGLKTLVSLTTALSLQYEKCWIVLYAQDEKSYPFGGCVPTNLALLHASLAHYCPKQDHYEVKVLCTPSCEEAAQMVRRISEETHKNCKVWSYKDWIDRSWLTEDMNKAEKFLLNFPCLNAFSAQLMLRKCSLGQLLSMDLPQLQATLPWLPEKALELFCTMCHVRFNHGVAFTGDASEWGSTGAERGSVGFQNMQETECDYVPTPTSNDSAPQQLEVSPGQDAGLQYGYTISGDGYMDSLPLRGVTESDVIVLSSEDERDANLVNHIELNRSYSLHGQFGGAFASEPSFSRTNELPDAQDGSFCHSNSYSQASYMSPRNQFPPKPSSRPTTPIFSMFGASGGEYNPSRTTSSFHLSPAPDTTQTTPSMLDFPQPISPPPYTSLYSRNQPVALSKFNTSIHPHQQPPSTAKRPAFASSSRIGKTPSQKQIKNVVMSKLSGGSQPPEDNTSRLAKEYYSGPVSSRFLASAAVRHTSTPLRNPIKSLDLGFESLSDKVQRPQFQSNDRSIAATCSTNGRPLSNCNVVGSRGRNVSVLEDVRVGSRPSGLLDLKAFHSRERQQVIQESRWNPMGVGVGGNTSVSTHTSRPVDNWLGMPCLISKATRHKRPYSDGLHSDYHVPSEVMSPEGVESSLYGSPSIGLVMLSPTMPKKKRLALEKLPGSTNGQTRLTFS